MSHFCVSPARSSSPTTLSFKKVLLFEGYCLMIYPNEINKFDYCENDDYLICWQGEIWDKRNPSEYFKSQQILANYKKSGHGIAEQLSGNFALLVFEKTTKQIVVFTDKYNTIPVFYSESNPLILSSEYEYIMPLISDKSINYDALSEYFLFDSIVGVDTLLKKLKKMPANSITTIHESGYSRIDFNETQNTNINNSITLDEIADKILTILKTAINRSFANYELNDLMLTLSGGLDSRMLLALIDTKYLENIDVLTIHSYNLSPENDSDVLIAKEFQKKYKFNHKIVAIDIFDKSLTMDYFSGNENFMFSGKKLLVGTYGGEFLTGALKNTFNSTLKKRTIDYTCFLNRQFDFFLNNRDKKCLGEIFTKEAMSSLSEFPSAKLKSRFFLPNGLLNYSIEALSSSFFSNVYNGSLGAWLQPYKAQNGKLTFYLNPELLDFVQCIPTKYINDDQFNIYHTIYSKLLPDYTKIPTNNTFYTIRKDAVIGFTVNGNDPKKFRSEIDKVIKSNFKNTEVLIKKGIVKRSYLNKIENQNDIKEIAKLIDLSNWLLYFKV